MTKEKQAPLLTRFTPYMGAKKALLPISLALSAISAALHIVPFVLVWVIVREIFRAPDAIDVSRIGTYAALALAAELLALLSYFAALMCSHLAAFRVEVGLQKVGMARIMAMPLGFFDRHSSGKMRKIINDGAGTTHTFLAHQLPDLAGTVVSPVILLILIFAVDWRLGLAVLVPIILGFLCMSFMMSTEGKEFQIQYLNALEEMSSESVEYVRGIPVVKTFGQSVFSFQRFYDAIMRYKDMVFAYTLNWRKPMSFYSAITQSAPFFLIPVAILLIGNEQPLPVILANFIFYLLIAPIFTVLLMKSMYFRQNSLIAGQALDRIDHLLDTAPMPEPEAPADIRGHSLTFEDVHFAYDEANPVLKGISFTLNEGERIALVGPSGSGKTTIARLAARFWDPDSGQVRIGDIDVKAVPKTQLMDHISFVFQNTRLFKGTLRDNILYGNPTASNVDIQQALILSQSKEIIDNLPDGLDTVIGAKGTYLSGGEQQRIALARALVKDAPIVLLDEATAFADPENEHLIQKALQALSHNKTTLMIAHRLTSITQVDRILVIDDGQIVESGTHEDLLQANGLYKSMWDEYQTAIDWKITA